MSLLFMRFNQQFPKKHLSSGRKEKNAGMLMLQVNFTLFFGAAIR